jgi:hypothetical protein
VNRRDRLVDGLVSLGRQAAVFVTGMTVAVSFERGLWILAGVAIGTLVLGLMGTHEVRRDWRASRSPTTESRRFTR